MTDTHDSAGPDPLRLGVVPGVMPGRWVRTWTERARRPVELVHVPASDQLEALRAGSFDLGVLRLAAPLDGLNAIRLYAETTVVVVPQDHPVAAADEVTPDDLAEETLLVPEDDVLGWAGAPGERSLVAPASTAEAVEAVAAGIGALVVPQSLARLHHRRDLTYRPVTGAPTSTVSLVWLEDRTTPAVELFVGVVRGRTANSSRDGSPTASHEGAGPEARRPPRAGDRAADRRGRGRPGPRGRRGPGPRRGGR